jgi:hypothetical protein
MDSNARSTMFDPGSSAVYRFTRRDVQPAFKRKSALGSGCPWTDSILRRAGISRIFDKICSGFGNRQLKLRRRATRFRDNIRRTGSSAARSLTYREFKNHEHESGEASII